MISIIVSTYRPEFFSSLSSNIGQTIGVEYEIIKIDNPGIMGITQAYNLGISKAKHNYLCFCHEDILFHTKDWGEKLIELFNSDPEIGLIGVAGSPYLPYVYSGWSFPQSKFVKMNLIHSTPARNGHFISIGQEEDVKSMPVATIDGCFMSARKGNLKFDETFKSFHCYDLDFSLKYGLANKNIVTYEIVIEHFSDGNFSYEWLIETKKLNKKWETYLPVRKVSVTASQVAQEEIGAYWFVFNLLIKNGKSIGLLLKYFVDVKFIRMIGLRNHLKLVLKTLRLSFLNKASSIS